MQCGHEFILSFDTIVNVGMSQGRLNVGYGSIDSAPQSSLYGGSLVMMLFIAYLTYSIKYNKSYVYTSIS